MTAIVHDSSVTLDAGLPVRVSGYVEDRAFHVGTQFDPANRVFSLDRESEFNIIASVKPSVIENLEDRLTKHIAFNNSPSV